MTTEIQNQLEIQLQVFEQMMDEDVQNDIYEINEESDDDITPTDEEREELERDLIDIALQTRNKNYTFVRVTTKNTFRCRSF
jgi:hypothetical protein